jgi:hypothetical protein
VDDHEGLSPEQKMVEEIAVDLDEDHRASGFELGRVEHGEHRRMARIALDALRSADPEVVAEALGWEKVGRFAWTERCEGLANPNVTWSSDDAVIGSRLTGDPLFSPRRGET